MASPGEYPRLLYKAVGVYLPVENDAERDAALREGWHMSLVLAEQAAPEKRRPGRPKKGTA